MKLIWFLGTSEESLEIKGSCWSRRPGLNVACGLPASGLTPLCPSSLGTLITSQRDLLQSSFGSVSFLLKMLLMTSSECPQKNYSAYRVRTLILRTFSAWTLHTTLSTPSLNPTLQLRSHKMCSAQPLPCCFLCLDHYLFPNPYPYYFSFLSLL